MPDVYDALAAPARRAILDALAERADQTLFELVNRLGSDPATALTRQAVSQHLQVLEDAGLVERRRQGRYVLHTLTPEPLREIARRWLTDPQEQS
ncbi:helix-turn-helix transcriptional regulator [Demequina sp. NBRC 110056]|uniref:ArsR/SmtB family transcription factor n=1 Tax=Demequina sp. NBRC 110056 TaxID=1570345 RepID=UPI000A0326B4|nr:metalloregulator ArsR/SmtB family transcription factor [Demequina sp. NBRC 110056]